MMGYREIMERARRETEERWIEAQAGTPRKDTPLWERALMALDRIIYPWRWK